MRVAASGAVSGLAGGFAGARCGSWCRFFLGEAGLGLG